MTPLAIANPEAEKVVVLFDQGLQAAPSIFVHPLVNTASLQMSGAQLGAAMKWVLLMPAQQRMHYCDVILPHAGPRWQVLIGWGHGAATVHLALCCGKSKSCCQLGSS